jgi:hypothetical protein
MWEKLLLLLSDCGSIEIIFQFVFSHCGVAGNEEADVRALDAQDIFDLDDQT